ncbi:MULTISPECIES: hypothetical protein [Fischerella]|uniref:Uncharacterized protein n=1 Tax=Fischerella muscicola CCMEE 5323 TaxID=2019572 RepID=A0A2N6K8F1_FISMU|nr:MULTISPECIES: hypothetical protein [Fischerella]MBD2432896.1 hypothetical protein [Fischerella sp. FACHB-380]PLZ93838.1 hypothetical protein CEN44_02070 [Fischerella muscicola CCMEE 5323]
MLSREELEALSLEDLQQIARSYGIQPPGNYNNRESWINVLTTFPYKAIEQMRDGIGLHSPGIEIYKYISVALDMMGEPTDTQRALLKATEGAQRLVDKRWRMYQEKMYKLYRVKLLLHQAVKLLTTGG